MYTIDMFLAVIVSATEVGNTRPSSPTPETVVQIHDVGFYCLTSSIWDDLLIGSESAPSPGYGDQSDPYMRDHVSGPGAPPPPEHPCQPLRKIIAAGTFYYAMEPQWDISSRLQRRLSSNEPWDAATYDDRFVWNEYIVRSLLDFRQRLDALERAELDRCQFIVSIPRVVPGPPILTAQPPHRYWQSRVMLGCAHSHYLRPQPTALLLWLLSP